MPVDFASVERVQSLRPDELLAPFNEVGAIGPADVHVAKTLGRLAPEADERAHLAVALAVRAPRMGHVLVDLASVRETLVAEALPAEDEASLARLPWPELGPWLEALRSSHLVSVGPGAEHDGRRPLRLVGTRLYLERYWGDEGRVAADLLRRAAPPAGSASGPWPPADGVTVSAVVARLFPEEPQGLQARAAAGVLSGGLSVLAGGPGTGKTTTVARALALLYELALGRDSPPPLVALAAPTGKAAARMAEAVHEEAQRLDISPAVRGALLQLEASTVHRLLGRHPAGLNRFRHDRDNRLPHDVVVVDETSMMSLPLMARLVEAVRPGAHLLLVGDPEQLASVEAGAVLADVVGPASGPAPVPSNSPMAAAITVLRANHRFSGPLADLAAAVRAGDEAAVLSVLRAGPATVVAWEETEVGAAHEVPGTVRRRLLEPARELVAAAGAGDAAAALAALRRSRLLCAHRDGPAGASTWNAHAEQWLYDEAAIAGTEGPWYVGRPVLVTENDYSLGLFNGDSGVTVRRPDGGLGVVFPRGGGTEMVSPSRLGSVQTAFAMTAHRAQGSEFDDVVVVLPAAPSRLLTRELLYTALTRARRRALVVGSEEAVVSAVSRPVARASGLTGRLWGPEAA